MSKKVKAIIAGVLGLLAVLVLLNNFTSLFDKKPEPIKPPVYTPEEQQQLKVEQQKRDEWQSKQRPPSGS